jgi:hypothetical protein
MRMRSVSASYQIVWSPGATFAAGGLRSLFTQCRPCALGQMRNGALALCSGRGFFDVAARCGALLGCCHNLSPNLEDGTAMYRLLSSVRPLERYAA